MPPTALKMRTAPSVVLALDLAEDGGAIRRESFRLCFDVNAMALIRERSGFEVLNGDVFDHTTEAAVLRAMLHATMLAHHPEYASEEGVRVVGSFIDAGNAEQIANALNDAFLAALPKQKQEELRTAQAKAKSAGEDPMPAKNPSPGSSSGPSADTTSVSPIAQSAS